MALAGKWLDANQTVNTRYVTPLRQGTGIDLIHGERGGAGRNSTPTGNTDFVTDDITSDAPVDDYGYCDEDQESVIFGYGPQTGTSVRVGFGDTESGANERAVTGPDFPSYGRYVAGRPGGSFLRSIDRGSEAGLVPKAMQPPGITESNAPPDWDGVLDAGISDPSQYVMQTSMTQRDKTREGSQISGTASEYFAPIHSRIPGMRIKDLDSNPSRHINMEPKDQDLIIRPFWLRTAGTGNRADMAPNELYVSQPMFRVAPDNPQVGPDVPSDLVPSYEDYTGLSADGTW